jgi:hypothetical protein
MKGRAALLLHAQAFSLTGKLSAIIKTKPFA